MALQSMTGFSRATISTEDADIVWEVRSVNGRNLDVRFRSTNAIEAIEQDLKKIAGEFFTRGNIGCTLTINFADNNNQHVINQKYLDWVMKLSDELEKSYGIRKPSLDGLLNLRGIIEYSSPENATLENGDIKNAITRCFVEALRQLKTARESEGHNLGRILSGQIDEIEGLVNAARQDPARSPEAIKLRLKLLIDSLLECSDALDPQRLNMEAVLLAAKVDIQEELDRLDGHIEATRNLLSVNGPVGRKLDFLAQEFNREANTLCSKAHTSSLSTVGLALKAVIDQFREQIQNIE
ncbi:YicC/YloC family endoribonuclease [uncultured Bartonella sp.]|uniref:YicC/YloC family endoribonuclease n=1 Tax=uncultured Bartonella sp. TaxID=104108 RepID=UPI0026304F08|nr:YicC/YloC family endoribonuclease [uncultured Bartonella sp.]